MKLVGLTALAWGLGRFKKNNSHDFFSDIFLQLSEFKLLAIDPKSPWYVATFRSADMRKQVCFKAGL